ncbi:glutamyl aminopeptidase-like isoform X2 [Plodia interpunctella]|uniref:glutamyl aminopeptidase-like isoform X2 n=1 Tax=Plodia interpunctella TaxID=58824 RepID=UPI002367582D|nr:glutamyl aminopeptidase-like isoform X2 [Plodia interpunctella]
MRNIYRVSSVLVISLSIVSVCLLLSTTTAAHHSYRHNNDIRKDSLYYRLPREVVPINYKLHLRPNIENKTFDGNVNITIKTLSNTNIITLHSNKLIIKSISLRDDSKEYTIKSSDLTNDSREFLNIHLQDSIPEGTFELGIDFSGNLSGLVGLYASTFSNKKNIRTRPETVQGKYRDIRSTRGIKEHSANASSHNTPRYGHTRSTRQENPQENYHGYAQDTTHQVSDHDSVRDNAQIDIQQVSDHNNTRDIAHMPGTTLSFAQNSTENKQQDSQDSAEDSDVGITRGVAQDAQNSAEYRAEDRNTQHWQLDSVPDTEYKNDRLNNITPALVRNSPEFRGQDSGQKYEQESIEDDTQSSAYESVENYAQDSDQGIAIDVAQENFQVNAQEYVQYGGEYSAQEFYQDSNTNESIQASARRRSNKHWRANLERQSKHDAWDRMMIASLFEPTNAREAFPCFDEPDFKATFDITLTVPKSYVALSNMNEISRASDEESDTDIVTFAHSVPMATYFAAFVICDFDHKQTEVEPGDIGKNFTLRAFAQKGKTNEIDFALEVGRRVMEFYIKYYEVPFPLPKLDMIAIPDFQPGAMEHWGLVTYRDVTLLMDEATASSTDKITVANVVTHELAHMWFGNLVTMKWWDDLWLNEGFATYMQTLSLNAVEPTWSMPDQFLFRLHEVLKRDAGLSSHPIQQKVNSPDDIVAMFDPISYVKGAAVLRMLEGFVGQECFRRGVSDYLKKYMYGNTVTGDFFTSMEPIFKIYNPNLDLKYRWYIPITYTTNRGPCKKTIWFSDQENKVTLKLKENENWLKINNNQVGFYRVTYPEDMWRDLIEQLKEKTLSKLTISDRAHLLNEVFALAEARVVPYELALDLTCYLPQEQDYVPWLVAADVFSEFAVKLLNTDAYEQLMVHIQKLIKPLYDSQSWEKNSRSVIDGLLRTTVLHLAAWCLVPDAVEHVRSLLQDWLKDPDASPVEPDLRSFVYSEGMKSATQEEWDRMWEIYQREEDAQEQAKLRAALAAPRDTEILKKYLTLSWDENNIRRQDYLNVLQLIAENPSGVDLVWSELQKNWPRLVGRFSVHDPHLAKLFPSISHSFNKESQLKEMEHFVAQYPEAGPGEILRKVAFETVRNNVQWQKTHYDKVSAWLRDRTPLPPPPLRLL